MSRIRTTFRVRARQTNLRFRRFWILFSYNYNRIAGDAARLIETANANPAQRAELLCHALVRAKETSPIFHREIYLHTSYSITALYYVVFLRITISNDDCNVPFEICQNKKQTDL